MTIPLISASMRDYNDNAASCFAGGWARVYAREPLRGARVFRVKFFLRRCAIGRGYLLARLHPVRVLPFKRAGQQVAASTSLAVAFLSLAHWGFTSMPIRGTLVVNPFLDEISCKAWFRAENDRRLYRRVRRTDFRTTGFLLRFYSA